MGYAGWLLIPSTLHVLLRVTFGNSQTGNDLDLVVSACTVALSIWVYQALAQASRAIFEHPNKPHAVRHAAAHTPGLLPLLITLLFAGLATVLGLFFFILPGIIFGVWFAFAGLVTIFEKTWGLPALAKSRELTRGRFLPVLTRLWIFDIGILIILLGITFAMAVPLGYAPTVQELGAPLPLPIDIVLALAQIFLLPLWVLYRTNLYLTLKTG